MREYLSWFRGLLGSSGPSCGGDSRAGWGAWTPMVCLALAIAGCDCSGSVGKDGMGSGRPCTASSECPVGELCIDGSCGRMGGGEVCDGDVDGDGYGEGCDLGPDCDEGDPSQTGVEICDGWDNDCDGTADNGVLSSCGNCDSTCMASGAGAGTMTPWDIDMDDSEGVGVDDEGALILDSRMVDTHFIWIANTGEGTVSKVDTRTYVEVARYVTGPDGSGNDPSRTSVNSVGDVYVGNRIAQTVTKISALGADCPDTNGDGMVTTSTGPTDVLAWGMDDCVLWNTRLTGPGDLRIRAVAAQDVEGLDFTIDHYVWIGGWEGIVWKLDGDDGAILVTTQSPTNNYGFALDGNGQLWISGRSSAALGRIDTTRCVDDASCAAPACGDDAAGDTCVKQAIPVPSGNNPYGITVDFNQRVWIAAYGGGSTLRYDHAAARGSRWVVAPHGVNCHGIAADGEGWVWAACDNSGVLRLNQMDPAGMNGIVAGTPGIYAKGMAIDFDGKVWVINLSEGNATVIVPGPALTDAAVTTGVNDTPISRYTYSDMTGQQLRLATNPRGYYRRVFEGCPDTTGTTGTEWGELRWVGDAPPGTSLVWRARTAATRADLATAMWVTVATVPPAASPADVAAALMGAGITPQRFLEVEVQLTSMRESTTEVVTPRVFSMEVTHTCPPTIG